MPTYEYECTACGRHIEVFQRISENPLSECGACGGKLRKVFHPAGIVFKGSGFYATDSRSAADKGSSDKGSGEKTSSKDSKSTDASSSTSSKDSSSGGGSTSKAAASKESS
jgi:putative FmdB family regulatory protein